MPTATQLGHDAYHSGIPRNANPFKRPGGSRLAWFTAWDAARPACL